MGQAEAVEIMPTIHLEPVSYLWLNLVLTPGITSPISKKVSKLQDLGSSPGSVT